MTPGKLEENFETRSFVWDGEDCLYRDTQGRRVLADLDAAPGVPMVLTAALFPPGTVLEADGRRAEGPVAAFEDYCVAAAAEPGRAAFWAGPAAPLQAARLSVGGAGCGLVLVDRTGIRVDGMDPFPFSESLGAFWAPYWLEAEGPGSLVGEQAAGAAPLMIDQFDGWRQSSYKERGGGVKSMSEPAGLPGEEGMFACHMNTAEFQCSFPAGSFGLVLRRTFDRFHGRQRARVLVDGEFAGWWYDPAENRRQRRGQSRFFIPGRRLAGKSLVRIAIDPPAGVPLWSVGQMEVFALAAPPSQPQMLTAS